MQDSAAEMALKLLDHFYLFFKIGYRGVCSRAIYICWEVEKGYYQKREVSHNALATPELKFSSVEVVHTYWVLSLMIMHIPSMEWLG